jgi:hypothetical protein
MNARALRLSLLLIVLLLLLILPAPGAHAVWRYSGESWEEGGIVYSAQNFGDTQVLLSVGSTSHLINLGECKIAAATEYCLLAIADENDESHIKYQGGKRYLGMDITIKSLDPKVIVTRTMEPTKPGIGEAAKVTVTIENPSDLTLDYVRYEETIPQELELTGQHVEGSMIRADLGSLIADTEKKFTYTVRPRTYASVTLTPIVTYKYAGSSFNTTPSGLAVAVESPVKISAVAPASLGLDEKGYYNVTLESEEGADVALSVRIPPGLEGNAGDFVQDGRVFRKDIELKEDRTETVRLQLWTTKSGTYVVPLVASVSSEGVTYSQTINVTITAKADTVAPKLVISPVRTSYRGGDLITITATMENVNTALSFEDVSGVVSSELFDPVTYSRQRLDPGRTVTAVEHQFLLPAVDAQQTFPVRFTGAYRTPSGQKFSFDESATITVVPIVDIVDITRAVVPAQPQPGGNVTITVTAKNRFGEQVSLSAFETFAQDLVKVGGVTFAERTIPKDSSEQLYVYVLEIPEDAATSYNITTTISVKGQPEEKHVYQLNLSTFVPQEETVVQSAADVQAPVAEEVVTEKGFFSRLWDTITGWFS